MQQRRGDRLARLCVSHDADQRSDTSLLSDISVRTSQNRLGIARGLNGPGQQLQMTQSI
jgi:hypothetical protein